MRVLMFSWEYPPHTVGGLGTHVEALVAALSNLGIEIHLLTPRMRGGEPTERLGERLTVHRVDLRSGCPEDPTRDTQQANGSLAGLAEDLIARAGPFHLIHAHDWHVAYAAIHLKHVYRLPLIVTIHATERGRNGGFVPNYFSAVIDHTEWRLCYEAWRVIVTSHYMADELVRLFQVPRDKLDVIPNGVDLASYKALQGENLTGFRRRFAADDEQLVFTVGRLVYEKGMQTLVAAAPEILAEFPSVRFVVAGRGPMLDELQNMAAALGVAHRFCFTGYISDADRDRLYKVADVAVFPSLYEPFGIVALEAMAAGTPVVAAGVGGLAEIVELHETGMTHYAGNAESLAWAVRHTLRHPGWAAARARNALRKIREVYNWSYIADQTLGVYERVVQERQQVVW